MRSRIEMRHSILLTLSVSLAVLALGISACSDDSGGAACPEGQKLSTFDDEEKCRDECLSDQACGFGQRCRNGVCLPRPPGGDADAATDTSRDVDTGRCSPDARLTIYRGVTKCRPFCESDGDCRGALECEDGHCVDRSLDTGTPGDTSDVEDAEDTGDTRDAQFSDGTLTCREIIQCQRACDSTTCNENAAEEGTREGQRNFEAFVQCVNFSCPNGDQNCIDRQCGAEQTACFPDSGVSGQDLSCSKLVQCLGNCGPNDIQCERDCRSRTSMRGTSRYDNIIQCIQAECPAGDQTCVDGALTGACANSWKTCFGCP